MFTGIVEEVGIINRIRKGEKYSILTVKAEKVLGDTKIGESICTNGVCLTVTDLSRDFFEAYIMSETLGKSNLGDLKIGDKVNLERALSIQSRVGGHIVSGHIDGIGKIKELKKENNEIWITIETNIDILKYIVYKGSIAIDGISLTVAYVDNEIFKVSIIPHTGKETILLTKREGENVNLECDLIGKYVEKLLRLDNESRKEGLTKDFLSKNGFY